MKIGKKPHGVGGGRLTASVVLACLAGPAAADIDFTQTVDGWWYNKYEWEAQVEKINCVRDFDPIGTVRSVWARVVQKDGSKVGTDVFCTTMRKVGAGLVDSWEVTVPAGMIEDEDWWDADTLGVEIVKCSGPDRRNYNTALSPYGSIQAIDYPVGALDLEPDKRLVSLSTAGWASDLVVADGFDFSVYAYINNANQPVVLNHLDELGLSTYNYDQTNAFGSGQPLNLNRLVILGINLDPSWDVMPDISNGLHEVQWQLVPGGGQMITDQGVFQILQVAPLTNGWHEFCPADINLDGAIDFFDVLLFLQQFTVGDPEADWNSDGVFNFFDVLGFLQDFSDGCP